MRRERGRSQRGSPRIRPPRRARRQAFAVFARFAMRDFLRLALFLWMMPRTAALSSADEAALTSAAVAPCAVAFFASVFSLLVISRLRFRRFSDARVHLIAALMLGTRFLSIPGRCLGQNPNYHTTEQPRRA